MTLIGKLLAFVNLVVGLGILSWSLMIYGERPGWFGDIPVTVGPRQNPENFKQMEAEFAALSETVKAASSNWGVQRKILVDLEVTRAERKKGYEEKLKWTRTGNLRDKGKGFYEPTYDESGLLIVDVANPGTPIKGPDNEFLKGSELLYSNFQENVAEVAKLSQQIKMQREEYAKIAINIDIFDKRLLRMTTLRESVQAEAFFLASFEVNVYETRETVLRRKKQLVGRLNELGKNP